MLIDDDNVIAKALWDKLKGIYKEFNAQAILNLKQEMDYLMFEDVKSWEDHINAFTDLLGKLATYEEELTEKENSSKLLRSLPESISGLAMIGQIQHLEIEKLIQAMHA